MQDNITPRCRIIPGETQWIAGFRVSPDQAFFHRIIHKRNETATPPNIESLIKETKSETESLIRPSAIYGIFTEIDIPAPHFQSARFIGMGIVMIGAAVERAVEDYNGRGDLTRAFLLDAWGSAFVEGAAAKIDRVLAVEAAILGCSKASRRSPGFGKWSLMDQSMLYHRLDAGRLGLILTKEATMIPRKSVSFAAPMHPLPVDGSP